MSETLTGPQLPITFDAVKFAERLKADVVFVLAKIFHATGTVFTIDNLPEYNFNFCDKVLYYSKKRQALFDMFPGGMPPGQERPFSAVYFCDDFNNVFKGYFHITFDHMRSL